MRERERERERERRERRREGGSPCSGSCRVMHANVNRLGDNA